MNKLHKIAAGFLSDNAVIKSSAKSEIRFGFLCPVSYKTLMQSLANPCVLMMKPFMLLCQWRSCRHRATPSPQALFRPVYIKVAFLSISCKIVVKNFRLTPILLWCRIYPPAREVSHYERGCVLWNWVLYRWFWPNLISGIYWENGNFTRVLCCAVLSNLSLIAAERQLCWRGGIRFRSYPFWFQCRETAVFEKPKRFWLMRLLVHGIFASKNNCIQER